jgi:CHASE2 domain-containing sensor protein
MDQPLASQMILMWMNGLIAALWIVCGLTAFTAWRTFKQAADLRWLFGYLLLALYAIGEATAAWQWQRSFDSGNLGPAVVDAANAAGTYDLRFTALHLIAVFVVLFAFRTRRVKFDL